MKRAVLHALPRFAPSVAERIAALAERSLLLEMETWPKPGLVSHVDNGSHADMDASTFLRSAAALRPYFAELADAGARDAEMAVLRKIGMRAEHAMLAATGGVNTHRGAIFGLGLLCAAAGRRRATHNALCGEPGMGGVAKTGLILPGKSSLDTLVSADQPSVGSTSPATTLGALVAARWGKDILQGPRLPDSHGERARCHYGAGGARGEAAGGFANVYRIGLLALRRAARDVPGDDEAARVDACFALIAVLDDTNLLHRGGPDGLAFAQRAARAFVARGGVRARDWRSRAASVHHAFVARRLSPGGAADLLAMSLFVDTFDRQEAAS